MGTCNEPCVLEDGGLGYAKELSDHVANRIELIKEMMKVEIKYEHLVVVLRDSSSLYISLRDSDLNVSAEKEVAENVGEVEGSFGNPLETVVVCGKEIIFLPFDGNIVNMEV